MSGSTIESSHLLTVVLGLFTIEIPGTDLSYNRSGPSPESDQGVKP